MVQGPFQDSQAQGYPEHGCYIIGCGRFGWYYCQDGAFREASYEEHPLQVFLTFTEVRREIARLAAMPELPFEEEEERDPDTSPDDIKEYSEGLAEETGRLLIPRPEAWLYGMKAEDFNRLADASGN